MCRIDDSSDRHVLRCSGGRTFLDLLRRTVPKKPVCVKAAYGAGKERCDAHRLLAEMKRSFRRHASGGAICVNSMYQMLRLLRLLQPQYPSGVTWPFSLQGRNTVNICDLFSLALLTLPRLTPETVQASRISAMRTSTCEIPWTGAQAFSSGTAPRAVPGSQIETLVLLSALLPVNSQPGKPGARAEMVSETSHASGERQAI